MIRIFRTLAHAHDAAPVALLHAGRPGEAFERQALLCAWVREADGRLVRHWRKAPEAGEVTAPDAMQRPAPRLGCSSVQA